MLENNEIVKSSKKLIEMVKSEDKRTVKKENNVFDEWAIKNKKLFLKISDIEKKTENSVRDSLIEAVESGDDLFFERRKKEIKKDFNDEVKEVYLDVIEFYNEELKKCEDVKKRATVLKWWVDNFENDVKHILSLWLKLKFNEEELKVVLQGYLENKSFDDSRVNDIIKKKYGIVGMLFKFKKVFEADHFFRDFFEKYGSDKSYQQALELARMYYGMDIGYMIALKTETVANLDFETSTVWSAKLIYEMKKLDKTINGIKDDIKAKEKLIEKIEKDFETSKLFKEERNLISNYVKKE